MLTGIINYSHSRASKEDRNFNKNFQSIPRSSPNLPKIHEGKRINSGPKKFSCIFVSAYLETTYSVNTLIISIIQLKKGQTS